MPVSTSPLLLRGKSLVYYLGKGVQVKKDKRGHRYCVDEGGKTSCPQDMNEGSSKPKPKKQGKLPKTAKPKKNKPKATRAEMVSVRIEGQGKDAIIVLADGQPAPKHIKPNMIKPDWTDVKISLDPDSDVQVTAKYRRKTPSGEKIDTMTVYSDNWGMKATAAKFARTREGLLKKDQMDNEVQRDRNKPQLRDLADCTWLMRLQGTRPGSEADNKGVSQFFGHSMSDVEIVQDGDKVSLNIKGKLIPIKNKKTKEELLRRIDNEEDLEDTTYWLKSYGATTLEGRHIVESDGKVFLQFVGKESVWHNHEIKDPELANMLLQRKQQAGATGKLFRGIDESKLRDYAGTLDGKKFTPKDWRTQRGTLRGIELVNEMPAPTNAKEYKQKVKEVGEVVSQLLGNNPAMALSAYIDPTIFSSWRESAGV